MAFSRKMSTKKVDWQSCFLFPNVGTKCCSDPLFRWNGDKWSCIGKGSVGLVSQNASVEDPISAVLWTAKTSKVVTRSGVTHNFPREYVEIFVWESTKYYIAAIPSVYTVMLDGDPYRVLSCFGYDEVGKNVILFNVKNLDSEIYGVQIAPIQRLLDKGASGKDSDVSAFSQAMPAYSGKGVVPKDPEKNEVKELIKELSDARDDRPYAPPDIDDEELLAHVEIHLKREADLKQRLLKLIDPTFEDPINHYQLVENKITTVKRHRSQLVREETLGSNGVKGLEFIKKMREDAVKKLGVGPDGSLPLPDPPRPKPVVNTVNILLPKVDISTLGTKDKAKTSKPTEEDSYEVL